MTTTTEGQKTADEKHVRDLVAKAATADVSDHAMKYAQAALNAAHALATLDLIGKTR
jgi:hypothetical protein